MGSGLLQLRDALALCGRANAAGLSARLNMSVAMAGAMLEQLVAMGHAERVEPTPRSTAKTCAGCRQCPSSTRIYPPVYQWRPSATRTNTCV
ncbi:FeoC-like transcriptional regulator [Martelella alba]|uniref:Ferrous iron transporter C n=1 Tax=Martelella alba TaxID=2590451 RepID=A0ABY2SIR5_9HYPH|nr:FeoC-like transcriptional regulator [Martelella alba]TKI05024.1 ferrous iron transporter C [Martelella alba]